jgi:hypothetical protein
MHKLFHFELNFLWLIRNGNSPTLFNRKIPKLRIEYKSDRIFNSIETNDNANATKKFNFPRG